MEYRSYLHYLKSHGFLFKILIQMRPLSTNGAIWIEVFYKIPNYKYQFYRRSKEWLPNAL